MMLCLLAVVSCVDDLVTEQQGTDNPQHLSGGIGEPVLFTSGNVEPGTTRAEVAPYMEQGGRFVCKMYYHAKASDTDASDFDIEHTPITAWLSVDNEVGNSVYRRSHFEDDIDLSHPDYLEYHFDSKAQYFYWRNRLDHIFMGYADYNKLQTNEYLTSTDTDDIEENNVRSGSLFMYPEYNEMKTTWLKDDTTWTMTPVCRMSFRMDRKSHVNPAYDPEAEREATEKGESYDVPKTIEEDILALVATHTTYEMLPDSRGSKYSDMQSSYNQEVSITLDTIKAVIARADNITSAERDALLVDLDRISATDEYAEGRDWFKDSNWRIYYEPEECRPCDPADPDGARYIDLTSDKTFLYYRHQKRVLTPVYSTSPANTFDLRHGTLTRMQDQPDPILACTRMKPMGATQEANRVRLFFKHQFSQIQVNLTKAASSTSDIRPENIDSIELLGVTQKGYVFTHITPQGELIPPSYDPVDITKYNRQQLNENPYGTSFSMFEMADTDKPQNSLKSFNAIAFGLLQAIRITWREEGSTEDVGVHQATFKITIDDRGRDLKTLQSGMRYVYDFELRRGTIAFIRVTIYPWLLDNDLQYNTSGFIQED